MNAKQIIIRIFCLGVTVVAVGFPLLIDFKQSNIYVYYFIKYIMSTILIGFCTIFVVPYMLNHTGVEITGDFMKL